MSTFQVVVLVDLFAILVILGFIAGSGFRR